MIIVCWAESSMMHAYMHSLNPQHAVGRTLLQRTRTPACARQSRLTDFALSDGKDSTPAIKVLACPVTRKLNGTRSVTRQHRLDVVGSPIQIVTIIFMSGALLVTDICVTCMPVCAGDVAATWGVPQQRTPALYALSHACRPLVLVVRHAAGPGSGSFG